MGRKRLPPHLLRVDVKIRLPRWLVEKIKENGSMTEVIENAVKKYLNIKE